MERWKPIPGFNGCYEVSDYGRVRSVPHIMRTGISDRITSPRILSLQKCRNGYLTVSLGRKHKHALVHRLVAAAFISEPPFPGAEINHKNGIRSDNRLSNLEWVTRCENMQLAHAAGAYDNAAWRKPTLCKETGEIFRSSYAAAEWVNAKRFQYRGNVSHISSNIRTSTRFGRCAYGYHWEHVEKQPSTTIPKGSTPKRVEMGSPS